MEYFKIAKDIDPEYHKNYLLAKKAGVNFLAYRTKISINGIKIEKKSCKNLGIGRITLLLCH